MIASVNPGRLPIRLARFLIVCAIGAWAGCEPTGSSGTFRSERPDSSRATSEQRVAMLWRESALADPRNDPVTLGLGDPTARAGSLAGGIRPARRGGGARTSHRLAGRVQTRGWRVGRGRRHEGPRTRGRCRHIWSPICWVRHWSMRRTSSGRPGGRSSERVIPNRPVSG